MKHSLHFLDKDEAPPLGDSLSRRSARPRRLGLRAAGCPSRLNKLLKRRQVVEPMIGHMKADGLLDKNWLKGANRDALHALLCGAGHNMRMILRHRRVLYCGLVAWIVLLSTNSIALNRSAPASVGC